MNSIDATVEIHENGPLGRPYPVAQVGEVTAHRRYGSWLVDCPEGRSAEPEIFGVDPAVLQTHPAVRRFDDERRRANAAAAEAAKAAAEGQA